MTRDFAPVDHDACGVGFVAQLGSPGSRDVVERALEALRRLGHRGGLDADGRSGDGAGLLTAIPDRFIRNCARQAGIELPLAYALGMVFLPSGQECVARELIVNVAGSHGLRLLGWRVVPTDPSIVGPRALDTLPVIEQCFFAPVEESVDLESELFRFRKQVESTAPGGTYFCSLSSRTVVYKGLLTPEQLPGFYSDLADPDFSSPFAIFHQRYSTNTNPSWSLAQPFRFVAHNGEINTISANRRWLRAKEASLRKALGLPATVRLLEERVSDSASFDNGLEIYLRKGYKPTAAMWCMVPPAKESDSSVYSDFESFLQAHVRVQEPWDGPAALIFTDGFSVGAKLDRNGLRPLRYTLTSDGLLVAGSEVGIADFHDKEVIGRNRLGPGEMLVVDPATGRFLRPGEIPELGKWQQFVSAVAPLPINPSEKVSTASTPEAANVLASLGWSEDQYRFLFQPLVQKEQEAVWSMGDDAPSAFYSSMRRPLWEHCKQRFAQVTNPPIDPLREAHVMSLEVYLDNTLLLPSPLLDLGQLQAIQEKLHLTQRLHFTFPVADGIEGAKRVLQGFDQTAIAGEAMPRLVLLSDRGVNSENAALPALLALAAVWKAMMKAGCWNVPLVVETGQVIDTHHIALLVAAGASAVMPYVALEQAASLRPDGVAAYRLAVEKGLRKVMARMGVSTVASYRNGQLFETIGLDKDLRARFFEDAGGALGGKGLDELLEDCMDRHAAAFKIENSQLRDLGLYRFRHEGELHATSPDLVRRMHHYIKVPSEQTYQAFTELAGKREPVAIRDLLEIAPAAPPVPLRQVEPEASILSRFSTQAMSLGAISPETHSTLAVAMNRLGARSNTGEGGEDPDVYRGQPEANNRVKQVASARFGVTTGYLVHADELEIKIAQGAKPGEGGQLPAGKVTAYIARLRHSVPNTMLISPPPHHDIYSIEDLEQLIYDLRAVNPHARIGVKLVSSTGVGIVATGVAKAGADVITISGYDGGTGASLLTSIKNTGMPWEIGLRDAHCALVRAGLRRRVRLRVDGGFKFGRDVIVGALLGADEFGFGTAALLALGCVMARQCHLNTCPVGIATQDEKLRMRFTGKPEMVESYFRAVASEVRTLLAAMGACSIDAIIGAVNRLQPSDRQAGRAVAELLEPVMTSPQTMCRREPDGMLQLALKRAFDERDISRSPCFQITNADRAVGAHLSGEILRRRSQVIAPVDYDFIGTAGQSFGAFLIPGINLRLFGEANDYAGKGLSGGNIAITAGKEASLRGDVLAGNTVLYGATSGELYIAGQAGERFAVRNSGALAVVEGVGQHACEYMTAGVTVILGPAGRNLGAGMTGGLAYVLRDSLGGRVHNDQSVRMVPVELREELWLRRVLRRHEYLTGSPRAGQLLRSDRPLPFSRVEPLSQACCVAETWDTILARFGRPKSTAFSLPRVVPSDGLPPYRKQRALLGNR